MINEIINFIFDSWNSFHLEVSKPNRLTFLKLGNRPSRNASVPFLVFSDKQYRPVLFVKVVRNPCYTATIKKEYQSLVKVRRMISSPYMSGAIPCPLFLGEISHRLILIETALAGVAFNNIIKKIGNLYKRYCLALDWLIKFHAETTQYISDIDDPFVNRYILKPLNTFWNNFSFINYQLKQDINEWVETFVKIHKGKTIPIVTQHGDFSPHNIYYDRGKIKVADWEDCLIQSPPHLDLFHFLISCSYVYSGGNPETSFTECFMNGGKYDKLVNQIVSEYCSSMNIDIHLLNTLIPLCLIHAANRDIERSKDLIYSSLNWINRLKLYLQYHG